VTRRSWAVLVAMLSVVYALFLPMPVLLGIWRLLGGPKDSFVIMGIWRFTDFGIIDFATGLPWLLLVLLGLYLSKWDKKFYWLLIGFPFAFRWWILTTFIGF